MQALERRQDLPQPGTDIRALILACARRAGVGHIGSALSIADIMEVLVGEVLEGAGSDGADRDVLVLSKGHAALAYYCALHLRGVLSSSDLDTYCQNGSRLAVHPDHQVHGIDFTTGSLGHGLGWAAGVALAMTLRHSRQRVFAVLSDAELDEGSTWEAIAFAGHHELHPLTVILDENGQQALGRTRDILPMDGALAALPAMGWDVRTVDGHDHHAIAHALQQRDHHRPQLIRARTVAGRGVPFMERQVAWHYLPMSAEEYASALAAVSGRPQVVARTDP